MRKFTLSLFLLTALMAQSGCAAVGIVVGANSVIEGISSINESDEEEQPITEITPIRFNDNISKACLIAPQSETITCKTLLANAKDSPDSLVTDTVNLLAKINTPAAANTLAKWQKLSENDTGFFFSDDLGKQVDSCTTPCELFGKDLLIDSVQVTTDAYKLLNERDKTTLTQEEQAHKEELKQVSMALLSIH